MMKPEDILRIKELLPTHLGSEEIREKIASEILRRSIFSARMASVTYLAHVRDVCAEVVAGRMNRADATLALTKVLEQIGHSPQDEGNLSNPANQRRLDLIVDTQRQMAASQAQVMSQTVDTLDDYPGWELKRFVGKSAPREDWHKRWAAAGDAVGWVGAARHTGNFPEWSFIALKNSPIWEALGDGAGGFKDALGNPFPPFAYSSGLAWDDVERARCEKLGLIEEDEQITLKESSLAPSEADYARVSEQTGFDLSGGLL